MIVAASARIFSLQVAFGLRWPSADNSEENREEAARLRGTSQQGYIDVQAVRSEDVRPARRAAHGRYTFAALQDGLPFFPDSSASLLGDGEYPMVVYGPSAASFRRYFERGRHLDCLA